MARYQYRLSSKLDWCSNSGNALFVVYNPVGSGKKITIGSFEVNNLTTVTAAPASALPTKLQLSRATVSVGESVPFVALDSSAQPLPSSLFLTSGGYVSGTASPIRTIQAHKVIGNSLGWMAMQRPYGNGRAFAAARSSTTDEGIIVRPSESVALHALTFNNATVLRITVTLVVNGSPNRTWTSTFYTICVNPDQALFAINNSTASDVVNIRSVSVEEIGTFDTPYFRLVPVGLIDTNSLSDSIRDMTARLVKMDSAYPSPASYVKIVKDAVIYPYGMPENAFSLGSAGQPQGFSYLKTKDFDGPVFKTLFPENVIRNGSGLNDTLGHNLSHKFNDAGVRRAGIVIREGEAVALVSSAETAVGVTGAVGLSGWLSLMFGMQLTVEPKISPTLYVTGLKINSEVRIFKAGTTTEVAGQENVTSGTFSWVFDPEENPSVDVRILSLGYQNMRVTSVALGLADVTIPVQQQVDRQYSNA